MGEENQQHSMKKFPKKIIEAHRGAKGLVKFENTIEAFEKAIEVNSDAIELDVRKTKDDVIIVRHDPDYKKIKICDYNYNDLKNESLKEGFYMPTLEEVVDKFHHRILLDVELKEEGYEKEVLDIMFKHLKAGEFYIRSFNIKALRRIKKINKKVPTALLLGRGVYKYGKLTMLTELFPLFRIIYTKCNFVSPHYKALVFGFQFRMKVLRKPLLVWTVDDKDLMRKLLIDKNVEGIVSNYPDRAIEVLKENNIR